MSNTVNLGPWLARKPRSQPTLHIYYRAGYWKHQTSFRKNDKCKELLSIITMKYRVLSIVRKSSNEC